MCTNFHHSAYEIMQRFDHEHPKSVGDIYMELRKARTEIILGATGTIADFIEALYLQRDLERTERGYVLTTKGTRELERLASLVRDKAA